MATFLHEMPNRLRVALQISGNYVEGGYSSPALNWNDVGTTCTRRTISRSGNDDAILNKSMFEIQCCFPFSFYYMVSEVMELWFVTKN